MNKKGFTTVELIVSFVMVVILLSSLIGFTVTYRDRVKKEELMSQLYDFKNTITKTVYDDIISLNFKSMTYCVGLNNCVNFVDENDASHVLKVENQCDTENKCGVYVVYDDVNFLLPDSNLNTYSKENSDGLINVIESASNISSFELKTYKNSLYNLKMTFKHFLLNDDIEIMLTIN